MGAVKGTKPMITRKEYLATGGNATHRAYYAQFITPAHKQRLLNNIGIHRLERSKCHYFNDIPLEIWDAIAVPVPAQSAKLLKECGDYPTLAGAVCILKECARQLVEA